VQVYSVEAAATYGSLFFQGEYFWFNVDRSANTGLPPIGAPSLNFQGGYAQASYMLTGESHAYNPASASYGGINPAHPFSLYGGGWGAFEIAGRVSMMDLDDKLATATGIAGGQQLVYTAGLTWYPTRNVRIMLNYLHGDISKQASPTSRALPRFESYRGSRNSLNFLTKVNIAYEKFHGIGRLVLTPSV
jgi:phosphate-selective porin OprO/OprP